MTNLVFSNFGTGTLAADINSGATSLTLGSGEGGRFPTLAAGDGFYGVIINASGSHEIVLATAKSGDNFTVARAQEGTSAASWAAGSRFELRVTAGVLAAMLQRAGGVMTGDLDLGGKQLLQALAYPHLNVGTVADGTSGKVFARMIGARVTNTTKSIWFSPTNGVKPAIGADLATASPILTRADLKGFCLPWGGPVANLPAGWILCNGANGTPDLRNKFVVGVGSQFAELQAGGGTSGQGFYDTGDGTINTKFYKSVGGGNHNHGGNTEDHILTLDEMPAHDHPLGAAGAGSNFGTAAGGSNTTDPKTDKSGGGLAHKHGIPTQTNHQHNIYPPPWFALCYVMLDPSLP